MELSVWLELRTVLPPVAPLNVWCKKMSCKTSCEITGALRYQPVTRQASCLTDVKSALNLTPYCLHLLTLHRANKPKKLPSHNSLSVTQVAVTYKVGDPCYALYFGPRRDRDPRWVLTIVVKRIGTRSVNVRVVPRSPVWRRHIDELQRRYVSPDDTEPGNTPRLSESREENPSVSEKLSSDTSPATTRQPPTSQNVSPDYGPSHPRRSKRPRKPRKLFCC